MLFNLLFFCPTLLILVLIIKLYSGKKFNNKWFYSLAVTLLILIIITLVLITIMVWNADRPIFQALGTFLHGYFLITNWSIIVIIPLMLGYSIYKFIKEKDLKVILKTFITTCCLALIFYLGYGTFILSKTISKKSKIDISEELKLYMKASDTSVFPPLKWHYADVAMLYLETNDYQYLGFSSEKELIDTYTKYYNICTKYFYNSYYPNRALGFYYAHKEYEKALEMIDIGEKQNSEYNGNSMQLSINITRGDYKTALELLNNKGEKLFNNSRENKNEILRTYYSYLIAAYLGLKDFDKAYETIEEFKRELTLMPEEDEVHKDGYVIKAKKLKSYNNQSYYRQLLLYYYVKGETENAEAVFEEHLKDSQGYYQTFDKYMEEYWFINSMYKDLLEK